MSIFKNFIYELIKNFIDDWKMLFSKKKSSKFLFFKTLFLGFVAGNIFCFASIVLWQGYRLNKMEQERLLQEQLYQASGEAILPLEEEKELFSAYLSGLEQMEKMASDWVDQNPDKDIKFLKKTNHLPLDIQEILQCKIDDPSEEYPQCNGEYYYFYDFMCYNQKCSWTFCRRGTAPNSCIYAAVGILEKGAFSWKHHMNVLFSQAIPLSKWINRTYDWEISEIL